MTIIRKFTPSERKFCPLGGVKKYISRSMRKNISNGSGFLTGVILLSIIFLFISLPACRQPAHHPETKLKVLTTIAPLYSFTRNVAGDLADVDNLLPTGIGPHEYSFSPADIKKITEAHILIKNGVNLESWLDRLIASAQGRDAQTGKERLTVVDTSLGVEIINEDPHIWLSPKNAIIQAKNIRDALVKADPDSSERYMENTEKYIKRLETLDKDIKDEVRTWERKEFVAFHSAFLYFARNYGLKQVAVIQEFPDKQPTPKHIADVINTIKKTGVKAIFSEPQFSHKIVKTIAEDLKLQVFSLDTLETGVLHPVRKKAPPELSNGVYPEWYEDRMRANLAVLKKVLN